MRLTIEMHDPQGTILRELELRGITQHSVALTYAIIIAQEGSRADWTKINAAISARWKGKTALARVKAMAWREVEQAGRPSSLTDPSKRR